MTATREVFDNYKVKVEVVQHWDTGDEVHHLICLKNNLKFKMEILEWGSCILIPWEVADTPFLPVVVEYIVNKWPNKEIEVIR